MDAFLTGAQRERSHETKIYRAMLNNTERVERYQNAIDRAIKACGPHPTFLEVGAGDGIFSIHAARQGCKVYAVEKNPEAVARLLPETRGLDITVINEDVRKAKLPKADIIVSELIGNLGPEYGMGPLLDEVRDKYLKEGGVMVPQSVDSYLQPTTRLDETDTLPTGLLGEFYACAFHKKVPARALRGHPIKVWSYEWNKENSNEFRATLSPRRAGGYAGFFNANLYDGITLSNHPKFNPKSWQHLYLPMGESTAERTVDLTHTQEDGFNIVTRPVDLIVFSQTAVAQARNNIWQTLYAQNRITDAPKVNDYARWVELDTRLLLKTAGKEQLRQQIEQARDPHLSTLLRLCTHKGIIPLYLSSGLEADLDWLPPDARALAQVNMYQGDHVVPNLHTSSEQSKEAYIARVARERGIPPHRILRLTSGSSGGLSTSQLSLRAVLQHIA